jgi:hypothetical protein
MCIVGLSVGLNFRSVGCLFILTILAEVEENARSDGSYEGYSANDSSDYRADWSVHGSDSWR